MLNERAPIKVFISYAHADQELRQKLEEHLSSLKYSGEITIWQDQEIPAGANWEDQINTHLNEADLILLLISASFIASKYCWNKEVQAALQRHQAGTVQVVPIILKPIVWQNTPLGQLQALPTGAKPITQWNDQDAAFEDVVKGIRDVVTPLLIKLRPARTTLYTYQEHSNAVFSFTSKIPLRAKPSRQLGFGDGQMMLVKRNFFDVKHNSQGQGINHRYVQKNHQIIIDEATNLMWQKSGSSEAVTFADAQGYIDKLNKESFGGSNDWRLPTLEEVMSLVEPQISANDLYLADLFDGTQTEIWTADTSSAAGGWVVKFNYGYFDDTPQTPWYCYFVRAVRSSL